MILLFFIATILLYGFMLGCFTYCGLKIYRLPHLPRRWGLYVSAPYLAFAFYLLVFLITAPFAARPSHIVLWTAIARLAAAVVVAAAISLPTLFFFGWINGVSNHKPEGKDDPE
jgi:hypothetical protein